MFTDNKYRRWYLALCERARGRVLSDRGERHHVVPKSLGGSNTADNMVALTYREHFLAHWLLTKFTAGQAQRKMNHALAMMASSVGGRVLTSWQYARAKVALSDAVRGLQKSVVTRERMAATARNRSPEYREKQRIAQTGRTHSDETRAKLSAITKAITPEKRKAMAVAGGLANRGRKCSPATIAALTGRVVSAETREKLRITSTGRKNNLGRKFSEEQRRNMSAGIKAAWADPIIRARQVAAIREAQARPGASERLSSAQKEAWERRRKRVSP